LVVALLILGTTITEAIMVVQVVDDKDYLVLEA
jgi:hypothetical protein